MNSNKNEIKRIQTMTHGIVTKIILLVAIYGAIIGCGTFLFVFMNIKMDYLDKKILLLASFLMVVFYFAVKNLNKVGRKNYLFCSLIQNYVEKCEETENGFSSPRKNMKKSFIFQKDHIDKISSSMSEIDTMIERTKEQINECNSIISVAKEKYEQGHNMMQILHNSIKDIKMATSDMDMSLKIINEISIKSSVITEIVAKTELLAMNASIEAARAGDYGKGFSVVSEEVGDLARNSGKSAKQIKDLLNQSAMKVAQVIRATDERVKEGEAICDKVLVSYADIGVGIKQLEEQSSQILDNIRTQNEAMKNTSQVINRVSKSISTSSVGIDNTNTQIDDLMNIHEVLFTLAEDLQRLIAGWKAGEELRKNRYNRVKRSIQELNL